MSAKILRGLRWAVALLLVAFAVYGLTAEGDLLVPAVLAAAAFVAWPRKREEQP